MTAAPAPASAFHLQKRQLQISKHFLESNARHNLIFGGARSGKTFLFTRATCIRAIAEPESRHVILRLRTLHVRQSIWMDTLPKVLRLCWPDLKPKPHEADGFLEFPNGAELWIAGLDDKERVEKILGKEFATIYFNECSQIPYSSVLLALTRLAQKCEKLVNRAYYDLNPTLTGHWTNRMFVQLLDPESRERKALPDPENYAHAYMNPEDNLENLDAAYIQSLRNMPSRQRKRFYEGKYSSEQEGQLWSVEVVDKHRRNAVTPEELEALGIVRVIVAVDPSGAAGEYDLKADEIGITVTGIDGKGRGYLFEDASGLYSPEQWGRVTCFMFHKWEADRVVAEKNFGGDMVRAVIHGADPNVPYKHVTASRGKAVRAEPVAALYERGRIIHCGTFPVLEDELANFTTMGYMGTGSPNHADALVWGFSELFENEVRTGLADYLRDTQAQIDAGQAAVTKHGEVIKLASGDESDDEEGVSALAKIVTSLMAKPVLSSDTAACDRCGSTALVRIAKRTRCNQCGHVMGPVPDPPQGQSRAGLFK